MREEFRIIRSFAAKEVCTCDHETGVSIGDLEWRGCVIRSDDLELWKRCCLSSGWWEDESLMNSDTGSIFIYVTWHEKRYLRCKILICVFCCGS